MDFLVCFLVTCHSATSGYVREDGGLWHFLVSLFSIIDNERMTVLVTFLFLNHTLKYHSVILKFKDFFSLLIFALYQL